MFHSHIKIICHSHIEVCPKFDLYTSWLRCVTRQVLGSQMAEAGFLRLLQGVIDRMIMCWLTGAIDA